MALQLTKTDLVKRAQQYDKLKARVTNLNSKAKDTVQKVLRTTVTGGSSFLFGGIEGRFGGVEIMGAPLSLLAGGFAHALGFFGIGGDMIHAFGDGAVASFAHNLGHGTGRMMAIKSDEFNPKTGLRKGQPGFVPLSTEEKATMGLVSGDTGGRALTDAEAARLARNA